jgi:excisionase family DNA binding protein
MQRQEWLTVQQVAQRLECSAPIVREMIRDKRLPAVQIGKRWRVSASVLAQWQCRVFHVPLS